MGQTAYLGFLGGRAEAYLDVLGPKWAEEYGGEGLEIGMSHVVLSPLMSAPHRYIWPPIRVGAVQDRRRRWTSTLRFTASERDSLLAWVRDVGKHIERVPWVHPRHMIRNKRRRIIGHHYHFEWKLRDGKPVVCFVWSHRFGRNKTPLPPDVLAEKLMAMTI